MRSNAKELQDLREQIEPLRRAAIRLVAAFNPSDPEEAEILVAELGLAAGCSSQDEAIYVLKELWCTPVHATQTDSVFSPSRRKGNA